MSKTESEQPFSAQLEQWLTNKQPKTIESLLNTFGEKSFAIVVMILMFFPALPIPTGGITHLLELVVMLVALEMVFGRRTLWLPKMVLKRPLGKTLTGKAVPFMISKVKWLERYSRPRYGNFINHRLTYMFLGVLFFALALAAALAPPFSGLDTIPALAAVTICLALILDDALIFAIGTVLSVAGLVAIFFTGQATIRVIQHLF
jgi:hypothetical protein